MGTRSKLGKILVVSGLGLATLGGLITPAGAADTTATFTLTAAGGLAISAPGTSDLGAAATSDGTLGAQLGAVTASDDRGALAAIWTASVTSSDFTTGGETADETIVKDNASYWSGTATATTGTAVRLPGQAAALNAQSLDVSRTAFSASATVGNNSTTWNPTLNVTVPADAVVGDYTGTITHSIA